MKRKHEEEIDVSLRAIHSKLFDLNQKIEQQQEREDHPPFEYPGLDRQARSEALQLATEYYKATSSYDLIAGEDEIVRMAAAFAKFLEEGAVAVRLSDLSPQVDARIEPNPAYNEWARKRAGELGYATYVDAVGDERDTFTNELIDRGQQWKTVDETYLDENGVLRDAQTGEPVSLQAEESEQDAQVRIQEQAKHRRREQAMEASAQGSYIDTHGQVHEVEDGDGIIPTSPAAQSLIDLELNIHDQPSPFRFPAEDSVPVDEAAHPVYEPTSVVDEIPDEALFDDHVSEDHARNHPIEFPGTSPEDGKRS